LVRPAKETRQQMPSEPWAVPTGHEAKSSCRGADRSVQKALSYPGFRSYLAAPGATFLPPLRGSS